MSEPQVRHEPDQGRYVVSVDGQDVGVTEYARSGERLVFVHTEIDDAHEGEGLGSALLRGALDDVRERGAPVVPVCPFVSGWIERHDDYRSVLDGEALARLGALAERQG